MRWACSTGPTLHVFHTLVCVCGGGGGLKLVSPFLLHFISARTPAGQSYFALQDSGLDTYHPPLLISAYLRLLHIKVQVWSILTDWKPAVMVWLLSCKHFTKHLSRLHPVKTNLLGQGRLLMCFLLTSVKRCNSVPANWPVDSMYLLPSSSVTFVAGLPVRK